MKELLMFFPGIPIAIFGSAALFSCLDSPPPVPRITFEHHCSMEQSERVAKFIVDCASAANPKSDEEGEDLVEQCEETAKNVLCPEVAMVQSGDRNDYSRPRPCSDVQEPVLIEACKAYNK